MKIKLTHALRIIDCTTFQPVTDASVYSGAAKKYAMKRDGGFYIFTSPLINENGSVEILYKGQKTISLCDERIKTIYINQSDVYPVLIASKDVPAGSFEIPCSVIGFGNDIVIDGLYCDIKGIENKIHSYEQGVLTLHDTIKTGVNVCDEIKIKELFNRSV